MLLAAAPAAVDAVLAGPTAEIEGAFKTDATIRRLEAIPGVGAIGATAFAATADTAATFRAGRHFAASLGLTPRIDGAKVKLGGITKRGNGHLRRLLYLRASARPDKADPWVLKLLTTKPYKAAAIALASRAGQSICVLLVRGGTYTAGHQLPARAAGGVARPWGGRGAAGDEPRPRSVLRGGLR